MQVNKGVSRTGTRREWVEYGGHVWYRYPDHPSHGLRTYFRRSIRRGGQVAKLRHFWLHKQIWVDNHGPIPKGKDIHHIDGNPTNNACGNLQLVSKREHGLIHIENMAAAKWHRSSEGRKWHSEHAKRVADNMEAVSLVCAQCGEEFKTKDRRSTTRFCSGRCRHYARLASGVDNETRECLYCRKSFTVNRYAKKECCSASCSGKQRWVRRKADSGET